MEENNDKGNEVDEDEEEDKKDEEEERTNHSASKPSEGSLLFADRPKGAKGARAARAAKGATGAKGSKQRSRGNADVLRSPNRVTSQQHRRSAALRPLQRAESKQSRRAEHLALSGQFREAIQCLSSPGLLSMASTDVQDQIAELNHPR